MGLLRSGAVVASMTLISRILGFVRDMICAAVFGPVAGFDAFLVAFKIPNFMRRLFAEGAFSQAFVPVLADYQVAAQQPGLSAAERAACQAAEQQFINHVAGWLALTVGGICLLAMLAAPVLIWVFAPGFWHDAARSHWAATMLRITFPYLGFIALTAFSGAILNSYRVFAAPAITPVILNVCLIGAALVGRHYFSVPVYALAWGVLLAGCLQWCFQWPFLSRIGRLPKFRLARQDPGVHRVLKLMAAAVFGVSVAQLSLLLDTWLATFLPVGSVSWLYFADRLHQFPLGVFGVTLVTVSMPRLSKAATAGDQATFKQILAWAFRCVLLIGVPAAAGLFILAGPLLVALFQYGQFGPHDVDMAKQALWIFALGLPAFMAVKLLANSCYAHKNIRTPVHIAGQCLVLNAILSVALMGPLAHAGLALATTLGAYMQTALLWRALRCQHAGWLPRLNVRRLLQSTVAVGCMTGFLAWQVPNIATWLAWSAAQRALHLVLLISLAIIIYCLVLAIFGVRFSALHATPT